MRTAAQLGARTAASSRQLAMEHTHDTHIPLLRRLALYKLLVYRPRTVVSRHAQTDDEQNLTTYKYAQ